MTEDEYRDLVYGTVCDLVADLLYYDRKEDEDLPRGKIEELVERGTVSERDIIGWFKDELYQWIKVMS